MNNIHFLCYGPEMHPAYDCRKFFLETNSLAACHNSPSIQDTVQRSGAIWNEFLRFSAKLVVGSIATFAFAVTLMSLAITPQLAVTLLVGSSVFFCLSVRRMVEASQQRSLWLNWGPIKDPSMTKSRQEIKQEQVDLCRNCLNYYHNLMENEPQDKREFLIDFFANNPLNDFVEFHSPQALSPYYSHYIGLKESFENFQTKSEQYSEILKAKLTAMQNKGMQLSRTSEADEKIFSLVNRKLQLQYRDLLAKTDLHTDYLLELFAHIEGFTQVLKNETSLSNLGPRPIYKLSILWPEMVFNEQEFPGISQENFQAFLNKMNS